MRKKVKVVSVFVILTMMVLVLYLPTPTAEYWSGGISSTYSHYVILDSDDNGTDEAWAVFHDNSPKGSPPGEELFRIQENGRVGILNPEPTHTLDVNGRVRIRDFPQDDTIQYLVVADANGVLHLRNVNTVGGEEEPSQNWYDTDTDSPSTDINSDLYTYGKVGIGSNNPVTTLDVNGGIATNIIMVYDDYTVLGSDYTILVHAKSRLVRINLPKAEEVPGQILNIKRIDDNRRNNVVIDPHGSETIDGTNILKINTKFMAYTIQSDGSGWYIISSYGFMGKSHIYNMNR